MATIGDLVANLKMNTRGFEAGARRSRGVLGTLTGGLGAAGRALGLFGGAMGAVGLAVFVKGQMQAIDEVGKLSDALGITTRDLSGLQFAAEQAGSSATNINTSLQRFTRRLGEASRGAGEGVAALDALGLSGGDLVEMGLGEAFREVSESISRIPTQTEKAAMAAKLFGRSGLELINVMEGGRAGIDAYIDEAEKLGRTFSRMDAAKVEAANDAMNRVRSAAMGLGRDLAITLAPAVEAIADVFTAVAAPIRFVTGLFGQFGGDLKMVAKVVMGVVAATLAFAAAQRAAAAATIFLQAMTGPSGWAKIAAGAAVAAGAVAGMNAQLDGAGAAARAATPATRELVREVEDLADVSGSIPTGAVGELSKVLGFAGDRTQKLLDDLERLKGFDFTLVGADGLDFSADVDAAIAGIGHSQGGPTRPLIDAIGLVEDFRKQLGGVRADALVSGLQRAIAESSGVNRELGRIREQFDEVTSGAAGAVEEGLLRAGALPKQAAAVRSAFENLERVKAESALGDEIAELHDQLAVANGTMTEAGQRARDLLAAGVKNELVEEFRKVNKELERVQEMQEMTRAGEQLAESLRTPLEKMEADISRFQELLDAGAITPETFDRAVAEARGDGNTPTTVAGARKGSVEAARAIQQAKGGKGAEERTAKNTQKLVQIAGTQAKTLEAIASRTGEDAGTVNLDTLLGG